jgi:hypothetical protein
VAAYSSQSTAPGAVDPLPVARWEPPADEPLPEKKEDQMTSTAIVPIVIVTFIVAIIGLYALKELLNCLFKTLILLGVSALVGILVVAALAH